MLRRMLSLMLLTLAVFAGSQLLAADQAEAADHWVAGNDAGDVYVRDQSVQWLDANNCLALVISVEKNSRKKEAANFQYYADGGQWYYMPVYEGGWSGESSPVAANWIQQNILDFLLTKRP